MEELYGGCADEGQGGFREAAFAVPGERETGHRLQPDAELQVEGRPSGRRFPAGKRADTSGDRAQFQYVLRRDDVCSKGLHPGIPPEGGDIIGGFPGETEESFNRLIDNLKKWRFDRLGCFTFSPEEGTVAYDMPNQVPEEVKQARIEQVYEVQRTISEELNRNRINSVVKVTIDSISDDGIFYKGRSYGEAPEVDPEIYVISQTGELTVGESYDVKIVDSSDYELTGVTYELT